MAEKIEARAAQPSARVPERENILLVDDRPENLLAMEALLGMLGQNIVTARSGAEALRRVLVMDFAVILLDVSMPDMDGFETAATIRERPRSKDTPIIFITAALKNESHIFRGYAAGAVDYIIKPVVPDILRSKVAIFVRLARQNAELRRLNSALQIQAAALAAANEELEAFSYSVSHDLRAPLRGIEGFSQILGRVYADQLGAEGKELTERLLGSAARMSRLIDDLLKLSRVGRKELRCETVDLTALARGSLLRLQHSEPGRAVAVSVAEGLRAEGDAGLLGILIENLVSNAWKFSSKKPDARIEVGAVERPDGPAFFIRDNGVGFDMAAAAQLFTPFQRLHPASEFAGTGVGLATARRIVARHGGRIWADSRPGRGAAFYFSLPGGPHGG